MLLVMITGLSGAGRTTALKALEDQGFQVIDNLPLFMIPALIEHITNASFCKQGIVIGLESQDFRVSEAKIQLKKLQNDHRIDLRIIYLECNEDILLKRYNESRRPHPIDAKDLQTAIHLENKHLAPLQKIAELQLDTTDFQARHLRKVLQHYFQGMRSQMLNIHLSSFSYKKPLPKNTDLIIDVRFLSNPFYEKHLQALSGKDKAVQEYIQHDTRWMIIEHHFKEFLIHAILGYKEQGRFYLHIAFGCTGGQHRSVFVAEFFHTILKKLQYDCIIEHRDL